ncbi:MAG: polysaccharide biosynthesis tyrosine autokinase [Nitrospiraceae bacterium]|nr:polysaccharide biosynthesis tyrosine autokinase [Nitrospiraceae bacterium]
MSRIEKSLERAIEMRESLRKGPGKETRANTAAKADITKFEPGEPLISAEAVDRQIVCIRDPNSLVAEQYKKLRARILKSAGDSLNTVMVTSSQIGEGKTITAINLAVAVAGQLDHTVLLVDADLRNPSVHKYLGMKPGCGLADYLRGDVKLSDALIKTGIGKLVLLPAGNPPVNPSELLSSEKMKGLVDEIKNRYSDRYIIFDSSPLLAAADSISLAGYMDGVLLVVQAGHTAPKAARKALSLIKGCRLLGAVFNNVPEYLARQQIYSYNVYGSTYGGEKNPR